MLDNNLNIKITFNKTRFKATCEAYPSCSGFGTTKEIALDDLAVSISRYISKKVKQSLSDIFASDNYTQIITGNESVDKETEYLYSVDKKKVAPLLLSLKEMGIVESKKPKKKNMESLIKEKITQALNFPGRLDDEGDFESEEKTSYLVSQLI